MNPRDRAVIVAAMVWREAHDRLEETRTAAETLTATGTLLMAEKLLKKALDHAGKPPEKHAGCTCPTCTT